MLQEAVSVTVTYVGTAVCAVLLIVPKVFVEVTTVRGCSVTVGLSMNRGAVTVEVANSVSTSLTVTVLLTIASAVAVMVIVGVSVMVVGTPTVKYKSLSYAMGVPLPLFEMMSTDHSPVTSWFFNVGLIVISCAKIRC